MRAALGSLLLLLFAAACSDNSGGLDAAIDASTPRDAAEPDDAAELDSGELDAVAPDSGGRRTEVFVRLDGEPIAGTVVLQGGREELHRTDEIGRVSFTLDRSLPGEHWVFASHPEARIKGFLVEPDHEGPIIMQLSRYDTSDYEEYRFQDPGEPGRIPNTSQCGHCHQTIMEAWFDSAHRRSASNPKLHDLYFGPGGLTELTNTSSGACADCHAPGIDGALGGRGLGEATGLARDFGVHCDVCHRVDRLDHAAPAGVAGRLVIMRPSEPGSPSLGAGGRLPLTFGPSHDAANPRMGNIQRDHFRSGELCAGCHQHDQAALPAGATADPLRWPGGEFPVHSTYEEWRSGPFGASVPCQECHMPPDPLVLNGGDLQLFPLAVIGVQGGFLRPPGSVRRHSFLGPRSPGARMLELAAAVLIRKTIGAGRVTAEVTVKNVGCGHALPTGEPSRQVILEVGADCEGRALAAIDGDVIPSIGGYVEVRPNTDPWDSWPNAQVGDQIRVIRRPGGFYDYLGFGPFGDGTFTAAQKGMPVELFAGASTVTAKNGALIETDPPLAAGDFAYLVRAGALAGAPGFAFARVMAGDDGQLAVPHYRAVDVASDNRLLPQQRWTTTHVFAADCAEPVVRARLIHRAHPFATALERGWPLEDQLMTEVRR